MKKLAFSAFVSILPLLWINSAIACTDFRLTAKDGTVLITRSMEFAQDLKSNLRNSNRNREFTSTIKNKKGLTWKAKYGYLYVDGFGQDFVIDGINEHGLSFEYLYLPGETQYQTVPAEKETQAIPYYQFGDWVLGNFKTIDEVRNALTHLYVVQATFPGLGNLVFKVHAAIYEASGKGIVVEFVQGKMNIFANDIGILTNAPTYDWHIVNLRHFVNLSPFNPKSVVADGLTFSATGQGSGMVGLPGDTSPPSRFVKTSVLAKVSYQALDSMDIVNLGEHMINNVDIPKGLSRAIENGKELAEITQWVVFKDLTHKIFYYRTYNDMTLRSLSLDKIDFTENAQRFSMPLEDKPYMVDMSDKFLQKQATTKLTLKESEPEAPENIFNPAYADGPDTSRNLG